MYLIRINLSEECVWTELVESVEKKKEEIVEM